MFIVINVIITPYHVIHLVRLYLWDAPYTSTDSFACNELYTMHLEFVSKHCAVLLLMDDVIYHEI